MEKNKQNKNTGKKVLIVLLKFTILILIFVILFILIFGFKRISSLNMSPSLKQGDLIIYYRLDKSYDVGDVVIVNKDNKEYILRVVAKGGETVRISEGRILVNNLVEEKESFYKTEKAAESNVKYPYTVEKDKYFVVADYRINKEDSRTFGTVSNKDIKGRVISKLQIRNI